MKHRINNFCEDEPLLSHKKLMNDLKAVTSFEDELNKFGKKTLTLFIVFTLDIKHYKKALNVLGQLEQSVVGETTE